MRASGDAGNEGGSHARGHLRVACILLKKKREAAHSLIPERPI